MKGKLIAGLFLMLIGTVAEAQNVHPVTWVRKAVAPGTVVTLGTQKFVLVRMPMKEFSNTNRYVVEYLAPVVSLGPPISATTDLETTHSNETLTDPVTVSGYPAVITVYDGRSYSYNANLGFDDGLSVDASVWGTVTLKVGDTLLELSTGFTGNQQPLTTVPVDFTPSVQAKWNWVDPTSLVTLFDNWIDYIRVLKVN